MSDTTNKKNKKVNLPDDENNDTSTNSTVGITPVISETDGGSLKAPKSLVPNSTVARAIYNRFRFAHLERIVLYAAIEGLAAGNPPYDPQELERDKLAHIANFNTLDARGLIEKAALAYWNLLNEAQTLFKFEFVSLSGIANVKGSDFVVNFANDPSSLDTAEILARNLDTVVRSWPAFEINNNILALQLVKLGLSPVIWPNEKDWRWEVVQLERFFVADQAPTNIDKLTQVCVETDFTLQYLFEVYEKFKDSPKDSGPWDIAELKQLLLYYGRKLSEGRTNIQDFTNPMDVQRMLQDGDYSLGALYTDTIRLVSLLFVEYDGKVSHIIFDKIDSSKLLFRQQAQYKNLQQGLVIFTSSPGVFTLHSNIGVGHKLFAACQATMQLDCSLVDSAKWAGTIMVNTPTGNVGQSADQIRFFPGVPTNIGMAQLQQNNLGSNLQPLIAVSSYITQKLQYNISNSGEDYSSPDSSQATKSSSEAKMQRLSRFAVLKNSIAHYYRQQDIVVKNMVSKMLHSKSGDPGHEYAKQWKDLCIAEGVDESLFELKNLDQWGMPKHLSVKATRVAGDGSQEALLLALESLQAIAPDFGPRESKEYKRQYILATAGKEFVAPFLQDSGDADEKSGGASLAHLENTSMQQGKSALMSPDNDQRGHIAQHFALAEETIQSVQQQQMDVIQADQIMTNLIPHLEEHIEFFARSPFGVKFVEGIRPGWNQLKSWADLNHKNAARAYQAEIAQRQEQEAQQQKVLSEEELKNLQVQGDERRKDFKAQNQERRASRASQVKEQALIAKTNADIKSQEDKIRGDHAANVMDINLANTRAETEMVNEQTNELTSREDLTSLPTGTLRQNLNNINGQTIAPYDIE